MENRQRKLAAASVLSALSFRKSWRSYQQRVLDASVLHLADRKLHIVAAPGSGKTTLGLELFRRLGKPAIALSPTQTIRDQWIERLRDFVAEDQPWPPDWVSRRLDAPGIFTSITYQALHTRARSTSPSESDEVHEATETEGPDPIDDSEIEAVAGLLRAANVQTVLLDEAHHLRAEWWKALTRLFARMGDVQVISLTGTPPYDAIGQEWSRYEELCGPIDEEISVPELVKAGTLVAHQDFVWTVVASEKESEFAARHVHDVTTLVQELLIDELFASFLSRHPWIVGSPLDEDAIYADPEAAMVLLAFHKARNFPLPQPLLDLLDLRSDDIPDLTLQRWERLLGHYLFADAFVVEDPAFDVYRARLARRMRECHLLIHRQVKLAESRLVKRHLTQSIAKIEACAEIYRHELALRGAQLRQVILTDYIRDDDVEGPADAPRSLGAWPIFRKLVQAAPENERTAIALLTGRLVVVHEAVVASVRGAYTSAVAIEHVPGFRRLIGATGEIVGALTRCLDAGSVRCLVGTRSLLGEGWDAPCVNSLIIASNVGAYMLSNQMRGRALRVHAQEPLKAASVWHIVAIALNRQPFDALFPPMLYYPGLRDLFELEQRFKTFVGLDVARPTIENSLGRLQLPFFRRTLDPVTGAEKSELRAENFRDSASLRRMNAAMVSRLQGLPRLREDWSAAIDQSVTGRVVPSTSTSAPPHFAHYHLRLTFTYFLLSAIAAFGVGASLAAFIPRAALVVFGLAGLYALPKFLRAAWLWLRHLPVDGSVHQIGLAVRDTLCALRLIDMPSSRIAVHSQSLGGSAYVSIVGGSFRDQALFADCMRELLSPVENPRYLLVRREKTFGYLRKDYHAVPACIGVKKDFVEVLLLAWRDRIGPAELVYTRAAENRSVLAQARSKAFSNAAQAAAERMERWL